MDKNKKHNVLQIGLSALLLSILGFNPCYADDPAEIVRVSYDASSSDPAIGVSPDVFPKGDGVKQLTIKNNCLQEIAITDITSKYEQSYAVLSKPSEPIKIPIGETHTFNLQPGNCPYITTKEERINFDFSYNTIVDGNTVNKVFSIAVVVSCHEKLDQAIEAKDAALKAIEQERTAKEEALKATEQERTAKEEALKAAKTDCESACKEVEMQLRNKTREEDRKNCIAKIRQMQVNKEL